jgi:hypothetical protein
MSISISCGLVLVLASASSTHLNITLSASARAPSTDLSLFRVESIALHTISAHECETNTVQHTAYGLVQYMKCNIIVITDFTVVYIVHILAYSCKNVLKLPVIMHSASLVHCGAAVYAWCTYT